jgi:hypothetical protein
MTLRGEGLVSSAVDPVGRPGDRQALGVGIGIGLPLGLVALACALSAISDRLLYVGPLDQDSPSLTHRPGGFVLINRTARDMATRERTA